jgi:hypothetical protein
MDVSDKRSAAEFLRERNRPQRRHRCDKRDRNRRDKHDRHLEDKCEKGINGQKSVDAFFICHHMFAVERIVFAKDANVIVFRLSSRGRRCGRLRSFPLAALRSNSHPSPLLR